ncbi:cupin-like domain-containing protein [Sphingomonas suaedae]|uniref:Cupin-like domain-containing protein n=1 Tax=Sphingomonas suaedae TaxID=2599297 RepID=A0A518RB77_9SPHN|nr:cupin-like domain-containing protein [Sphingomonas suaedae]QDX24601.1 cupin-like domain-containing protein [Sphingomonas suaedae]
MTDAVAIAGAEALSDPTAFRERVMGAGKPVMLPGAASAWPLLAQPGARDIIAALREFDAGREAGLFVGAPETGGRYYYDATLSGFNFAQESMVCGAGLQRILDSANASGGETLYMGSLPSERYFPGVEALTPLPFVPATIRPRFWIGHASSIACHYDMMDNVACVAAGRRRFTLYPPQAIGDLYVGPVDHTMAGQPVALAVDSAPGDPRFPRFEAIRDQALVAELGPGDAIYIPKLWWHKVEALDDVNVLVNFWWDGFASGPDQPYAAMLLAMIAIAERPEAERAAWRAWFDHYVFRPDGHPLEFLPDERRGILGKLGEGNYQRIRTMVMRMLRG